MKNKILWIITVLPTIITAVALKFMPDKVPMHYGGGGQIDRWGSKYENFLFPGIIIITSIFWILFINHYKKKSVNEKLSEKDRAEARSNSKVLYFVAIGMAAMFGIMQCAILYMAMAEARDNLLSMKLDINIITNVCMGIFLIVIGNILPKSKRNGAVGVRTAWSTENDKVWAESNKKGGIVLIISGVVTIIQSVIIGGLASTFLLIAIIIVACIISVYFSYAAYKKYK